MAKGSTRTICVWYPGWISDGTSEYRDDVKAIGVLVPYPEPGGEHFITSRLSVDDTSRRARILVSEQYLYAGDGQKSCHECSGGKVRSYLLYCFLANTSHRCKREHVKIGDYTDARGCVSVL